jgi:hypothetical protein
MANRAFEEKNAIDNEQYLQPQEAARGQPTDTKLKCIWMIVSGGERSCRI